MRETRSGERSNELIQAVRSENSATTLLLSLPQLRVESGDDYAGETQRGTGPTGRLIGKGLPAYEAVNLYLTVVVNHLLKISYDASSRFQDAVDTETDA